MGGGVLILLDTHVLLWLDAGSRKIAPRLRKRIDEALADGTLWISAISFWETALLVERGRVELPVDVEAWRSDLLRHSLREAPVDGKIGVEAVRLLDLHADPADRIIVATARALGATLVTADERILAWRGKLDRLAAG